MKATLPLDLPALYKKYGYNIIRNTPFGNTLTLDIAKAAVEGENLGADDTTDLLAVSCSSTDYIGHQVGINAVETEDTYLRLDRDIASFLTFLDEKVGRDNYLIFLTADHGAMNNALYLSDRDIPSGSWSETAARDYLNQTLADSLHTATRLVTHVMNNQVFFDRKTISESHLNFSRIKSIVAERLQQDTAVLYAADMTQVETATIPHDVKGRIVNGYNRERSGDVQIVLKPGYYPHEPKGTDHGAWNPYDTHIPLVFAGWGISHGASTREVFMTDIAPTIAALLHIQAPSGCVGHPLF